MWTIIENRKGRSFETRPIITLSKTSGWLSESAMREMRLKISDKVLYAIDEKNRNLMLFRRCEPDRGFKLSGKENQKGGLFSATEAIKKIGSGKFLYSGNKVQLHGNEWYSFIRIA